MDPYIVSNSTSSLAESGTRILLQAPHVLLSVFDFVVSAFRRVLDVSGASWIWYDAIRFLLYGTILEAVRILWRTISLRIHQLLVLEVRIDNGDFVWDWLEDYLAAHGVWGRATSFRLISLPDSARSTGDGTILVDKNSLGHSRGHPLPRYQSMPDQPESWRWRGYNIKISKQHGVYEYKTGTEYGGWITLSVYAWNRRVIDELISAARERYIEHSRPRITEYLASKAPSVVTATFIQPDQAYDWMLNFLASLNAWSDIRDIQVTAKRSITTQWGVDDDEGTGKPRPMTYIPAAGHPQLLKWNGHWIQVTREKGAPHWRTGREEGGVITVMLHHSDRKILDELIAAARAYQQQSAENNVSIHLADQHGAWTQMVKKSRRPMESVILPDGVADMLLEDTREFLRSESWYREAGVPYRRGYLLYGVPGSGKSSTVHALASALMLPVYAISLAAAGLNDATLQALVADTPSECILTLEDIDCAFPEPRRNDQDTASQQPPEGEQRKDNASRKGDPPKTHSTVTLSGLLNVLDGVWSEEGRLIIATTNHIESLDPALIRPGRLDVKIEYTAATRVQAAQMFERFFPPKSYVRKVPKDGNEKGSTPLELDAGRLHEMATEFAAALPDKTLSAADLQGYLLPWKNDPIGALENVGTLAAGKQEEEVVTGSETPVVVDSGESDGSSC